ncbi:2-amino-4-hydroxy-6-hydroxymethyldihydropteridine diphosphokinase [Marinisporobacter balticus]|uniref:2-amino-4-hydroxy-6-hydroxymethyldihydropteridine diphosphokinase n=1 Tax=Marinisporobacter balticus TaxID=2018667 RepID=A0A4R2KNU9_9FIRM|nr:2-amino-4-hydroxy-6-hydroxymethyldihydropteridine diphosphokinase [Marinisporobacter balticus]TCO74402.1 2-amino-4-hydroxy-6-hydroxymethyldihydropteridine diphosphokinase [Marinisporobacter balticus]
MRKAYLGIGSNIGNKKENIEKTIALLKDNPLISVCAISSFYETAPVGYTDQDWFLNIVVEIDTSLVPYDLLDYCHHIENELKRERIIRWGPRTIDVDILLYEDFLSTDEQLIIPHPRMCERAFVMIPLYEIAKELIIHNKEIKTIVENLKEKEVRTFSSTTNK